MFPCRLVESRYIVCLRCRCGCGSDTWDQAHPGIQANSYRETPFSFSFAMPRPTFALLLFLLDRTGGVGVVWVCLESSAHYGAPVARACVRKKNALRARRWWNARGGGSARAASGAVDYSSSTRLPSPLRDSRITPASCSFTGDVCVREVVGEHLRLTCVGGEPKEPTGGTLGCYGGRKSIRPTAVVWRMASSGAASKMGLGKANRGGQ